MIRGPLIPDILQYAPLTRFIQFEPRGPLWTIYRRTEANTTLFRTIRRENGEECHIITRPNETRYHAAHAQKAFSRNLATLHPKLTSEDITETDTIYFLPPRNPGLRGIDAGNQAPLSSVEEEIFYEPPSEPNTEDLSDEELYALFSEEGL